MDVTSTLLKGFSVCILSASLSNGYTPEYLKKLVVQNSGTIVENPLPNNSTCFVVAGDRTYRVNVLCSQKKYDIVSMDWFLRSCEKQKIILKPRDMLAMTPNLEEHFSKFYDKWGDHYTEFVSLKELKRICDHIKDADVPDLDENELKELDELIYKNVNRNWFRTKYAYFYNMDLPSETAKLNYQWHGGLILDDRDLNTDTDCYAKVSFIFINPKQLDKTAFLVWLKERFSEHLTRLQIINIEWILESHAGRILQDIKEYTWHDF